MTLIHVYFIFLSLLYALLVACYAGWFRKSAWAKPRLLRFALVGAILVHLVLFTLSGLRSSHSLAGGSSMALSALALGVAVCYFLLEWTSRERNMGVWVLPFPLIFQILATLGMGATARPNAFPHTPLLGLHVGTALIGYCAFSLSAALSLMYLVLYHAIKARHLGMVFDRLPSLETLEGMAYRAIHFGLGFSLLAIVLGELMLREQERRFVWEEPKILMTAAICVLYGIVIMMRTRLSIRGKRFALLSIVGFAIVLLSLLAQNRLAPGFHRF